MASFSKVKKTATTRPKRFKLGEKLGILLTVNLHLRVGLFKVAEEVYLIMGHKSMLHYFYFRLGARHQLQPLSPLLPTTLFPIFFLKMFLCSYVYEKSYYEQGRGSSFARFLESTEHF